MSVQWKYIGDQGGAHIVVDHLGFQKLGLDNVQLKDNS